MGDPPGVPLEVLGAAAKLVLPGRGQPVVVAGRAGSGSFPLRIDQRRLLEVAQQAVNDTRITLGAPKAELGEAAADLVAVGTSLLEDKQDKRLGVAAETRGIAIKGLARRGGGQWRRHLASIYI